MHSLAELKFAISLENEFRYLREPVIIGYDQKTRKTTNYFREETKQYTPDFLARSIITGIAYLVEIKPAAFRNTDVSGFYQEIGSNYIEQHALDWKFKIIYDDEIHLSASSLEKYKLFERNKQQFEHVFSMHKANRKYANEPIRDFSSVPSFPDDPLGKTDYVKFVKSGIL